MKSNRKSGPTLVVEPLEARIVLAASSMVWETVSDVVPSTVVEHRTTFRQLGIPVQQTDHLDASEKYLSEYHDQVGLPPRVLDSLRVLEVKHGLATTHVRFDQVVDG
ncbi:MAG: hypothetical protein AAF497_21100, partial [Planctomycetota bacterium]